MGCVFALCTSDSWTLGSRFQWLLMLQPKASRLGWSSLFHLPLLPAQGLLCWRVLKALPISHLSSFLFSMEGFMIQGGGELIGRGKKLPGYAWGMARVRYQTARPCGRGSIPQWLTPTTGQAPSLWHCGALEPLVQTVRWCRDDPQVSSSMLGPLPLWYRSDSGSTLFCCPCVFFPPSVSLWRASCTLLQESPKQEKALGTLFNLPFSVLTRGRHLINYFTQ